jgi:hypothetical protein
MIVEYAQNVIKMVHEVAADVATTGPQMVHGVNEATCPKHGSRYVVRRGTTRCPVGRKRGVNCK